jgi:zinc/manganese transport system substrate-binding protein
MKNIFLILLVIILEGYFFSLYPTNKIEVVTTLTVYADIARAIGGDRVEVNAIVAGDQDAHYVKPKPSFAVWMTKADLFVETGLDLELWVPDLIDKSRNPKIRSGQPGYVAAADGIPMLEVPVSPDRSQGDVHIYGNPHIHTSPLNAKIIAENIAIGLMKVSPENKEYFQQNLVKYKQEIDNHLFGESLVQILGGETLTNLAQSGNLIPFLENESFQGNKLISYLGGWMKQMLPYRGRKLVAYHQTWVYFEKLFGIEIIGYLEPKPGIPPSPKHVEQLIKNIRQQNARVILAENYFDERKVREIAEKVQGIPVIVSIGTMGDSETYFTLVDGWINQLTAAWQ